VPNLLDLMGRWPWYIVVAAGLAVAIFVALDLPFAVRRRRSWWRPAGNQAIEMPR
jgi:uncharacterized membrane protein YwaF